MSKEVIEGFDFITEELRGLILTPIISDDKLVEVRIGIDDAPGLYLVMTAHAVKELRSGLDSLLSTTDWSKYNSYSLSSED
jgi:hypothetical protein